jgi:Signal transduction histidine kinase
MIKKLQFQLTLICTFTTILILSIVSAVYLKISENHMRQTNETSMYFGFSNIYNYILEQSVISHKWLLTMETTYQCFIQISENGLPLGFNSLHENTLRNEAFETAHKIALTDYNFTILNNIASNDKSLNNTIFTSTKNIQFPFSTADGNNYYASISIFPKNNEIIHITIIHSYKLLETQINTQWQWFMFTFIFSVLIFLVFFHILIRLLLKPIKQNHEKQIQFVSYASHELRSPLTVIISALSAMKTATVNDKLRFEDMIETETKQMVLLINDLLALTQTTSKSFKLKMKPIELDTLILQTYEQFEILAKKENRILKVELLKDNLPIYYCDEQRIKQVLYILLDNAFSYTTSNDTICISLDYENATKEFIISVSDTGIGIPDNEKTLIFEKFYRSDKSRQDSNHFGLGLSIANEIIKLHNGNISIKDNKNKGSIFIFRLSNYK